MRVKLSRLASLNRNERVSYPQIVHRAIETNKPVPMKLRIATDLPRAPRVSKPIPEPCYVSWEDYIENIPYQVLHKWCGDKARRANRDRFMSGKPDNLITMTDVVSIITSAKGRCFYCKSLCVETKPAHGSWAPIGRRIGSLGHMVALVNGGTNIIDNLHWSCLWCNVWPSERRPYATDHGGIQDGK